MNLLAAAHLVERYELYKLRVVKIRHGRVGERDVAVFADAHAGDIHRLPAQKRRIARALPGGVRRGSGAVETVYRAERHLVKQRLPQKIGKPLRRIRRKADVLVHMERVDALPLNVRLRGERGQHFVLGRGGCEDHVADLLVREHLADGFGNVVRRAAAHFGARIGDFHSQLLQVQDPCHKIGSFRSFRSSKHTAPSFSTMAMRMV